MTRLVKALPMVAVALFMCLSMHSASAQQEVKHRSYLYCTAEFGADKEVVEEKIGNYTRENKEWKVTLHVDYGQSNGSTVLKDAEGNKLFFNTEMAAINWLGMRGWELVTPDKHFINGTSSGYKLYFRLDVTGLSYEEINEQLSAFIGGSDVRTQKADGLF